MCVPTGDLGKMCRHRRGHEGQTQRTGEGGRRGMERDKENKKEGRGSMEITS